MLNDKSPFEVLHFSLPDLSLVRVFGALGYTSSSSIQRNKFSPMARKYASLGYKPGFKDCVMFDINSREIDLSRHVTFEDQIFLN